MEWHWLGRRRLWVLGKKWVMLYLIISIKQFLMMMNNQFPLGPSAQPTSLRLGCFIWYCLVFYFKLSDLKNIFNTIMTQCIMMKGTQYHEFKILMSEWTICWLYLTHTDHTVTSWQWVSAFICVRLSWLTSYLQAAFESHTPHKSRFSAIPSIIFIGSCLLVSFF